MKGAYAGQGGKAQAYIGRARCELPRQAERGSANCQQNMISRALNERWSEAALWAATIVGNDVDL